ncbi:MAG: MFS transporter [Thermoflexibacter sp.]|jgi:MFS family permease|nr:MFS transporter [Thermoflexibacter sp.]
MTTLAVNRSINWQQLFSLGALNAAVVISWIAYHNYQPKILEKFEVSDLALFMTIAQAIILVCIPPIAGLVGDYMIRKNGNHFVVMTVGISVTAMVFMAVAATTAGNPVESLKLILPFMIVIWLISMNIFHSPANSMLELFAPAHQLPLAMSVLTLITELLYALEPVVVYIVDSIGASLTFVLGGVLLVISGWYFKHTTKNVQLSRDSSNDDNYNEDHFAKIIIVGLAFGLANAILMNIFPSLLEEKVSIFASKSLEGKQYASIILAISALCAIPVSNYVQKIGVKRSLMIGLGFAFSFITAIFASEIQVLTIAACIFFAISFSIVAVSSFPFVLENVSKRNITFGAGLFFGSFEVADGLMNIFM